MKLINKIDAKIKELRKADKLLVETDEYGNTPISDAILYLVEARNYLTYAMVKTEEAMAKADEAIKWQV